MAIQNVARFVGTGKPMTPQIRPIVDRSASRYAIQNVQAERFSEFRAANQRRAQPTLQELGSNSSRAAEKINSGRVVDLTI